MHPAARFAAVFALAACAGAASSQPAPAADPGAPPAPRVRSANGIEYMNGGAGEEARTALAARGAEFPLRIVFSVPGGAFAVADHVDLANASGSVLGVDNAGPMLMVKLPPGDYTVAATYAGKTEKRPVRVGSQAMTLNWRLPDEKPKP